MKIKHFGICVLAFFVVFASGCNKKQSTISVLGTGTVLAQPDVIQMNITFSNVAQTTKSAQEAVSKMVRQALEVLKDTGIEDKNIMTASLVFRSEYDYYSNRRNLIGQRAEQGLTFSVENIDNDSDRVSEIIDRLIQINGIELNQLNFSVKDTTGYFIESRELAFQKALEKATQYAELSNLKIIKVLSISDDGIQQAMPMSNMFARDMVAAEAYGSTIIPAGELEITTRIVVVFLLE